MKVIPYIQKLTSGLHPKYLEFETELLDWFKESRSQLKVVTRYMIQAKARSFAKRAVYQEMYTNIMKCSKIFTKMGRRLHDSS